MKKTPSTEICRKVGFTFNSISSLEATLLSKNSIERKPVYSRFYNPTIIETERKICGLEQSNWSVLTSSGMSAIDVALSVFQDPKKRHKPWIFLGELYSGTLSYINHVLVEQRGVKIEFLHYDQAKSSYNLDKLVSIIKSNKPALIFFEIQSNPMLYLANYTAIIKISKQYGVKVIIDNTFLTPLICRPLNAGADLVLHSATKFLSGHNNIMAGVISGNCAKLETKVRDYLRRTGAVISPDIAYMLSQQMEEFETRFVSQCNNAKWLSYFLKRHKNIEKVIYPALNEGPSNKQTSLFKSKLFGGIMVFKIKPNGLESISNRCEKLVAKLSPTISLSTSLGSISTTLIYLPTFLRQDLNDKKYAGYFRLSAGIEDIEKLKKSISYALNII